MWVLSLRGAGRPVFRVVDWHTPQFLPEGSRAQTWNPAFVPRPSQSLLLCRLHADDLSTTSYNRHRSDRTGANLMTALARRRQSPNPPGPSLPVEVDCITAAPTPVEFVHHSRSNGGSRWWRTIRVRQPWIQHLSQGTASEEAQPAVIAGSALITGHTQHDLGQAYSCGRPAGRLVLVEEIVSTGAG
jgi:hypothetical protein